MGHIVRNTSWGVIDLNTNTRQVLFRQRWYYDWKRYTLKAVTATEWTYPEQYAFHKTLDRQIWGLWSGRITLGVAGTTPLAKQLLGRVALNLDVQWVLDSKAKHFTVEAYKMPSGSDAMTFRSEVIFAKRLIRLNGIDLMKRGAKNDADMHSSEFYTPPHEFGHAIQWGDEYTKTQENILSMRLFDVKSIMNIGTEIRARHLTHIIDELNKLDPGTVFSVQAIH